MLTNHEKIQPALIRCHEERLERVHMRPGMAIQDTMPSRFRAVVDELGNELGHVSGRFRSIQTADVIAALDIAAENAGIALEPLAGYYRNGLAKAEFGIPGRIIAPDSRDGGAAPRLIVRHGLGGRGGLTVSLGCKILVCSNGMTVFKVLQVDYARHTGSIDIAALVERAVGRMDAAIQSSELLINQARAASATDALLREVLESAPARQATTFQGIMDRNVAAYGQTGWALIQSVTELATHHMRERRDGSHVWSADDWSARQTANVARVLQLAR